MHNIVLLDVLFVSGQKKSTAILDDTLTPEWNTVCNTPLDCA